MKIMKKNWPLIILIISTLAVGFALIAEHFFNILPCKMCLYQRYPYYFIIFICLIYVFIKKLPQLFFYWITEFTFFIGLFYATWHVGIEKKILPGLSGCTNTIQKSDTLAALKKQIINQNIVSCDEITWTIAGFSAATLNSLLLVLLLLLNTIFIINNQNDKEKI